MSTIGKKIKTRREELMLSQEELAKMVGYKHKSSINKIELGTRDIPRKSINLFARALNVSVEWLLAYDDVMLPEDLDFLKSLPPLLPKQDLPPELEALNVLLALSGKQISKCKDEYHLDSGYSVSEAEINELLNTIVLASKNAIDVLEAKKAKEFINFFSKK